LRFYLAALVGCLSLGAGAPAQPGSELIRDVRLFDGETVLEHRSVLIENGVIARIGDAALDVPGARIVDGSGRTLLPGLIDAHVHIAEDVPGAARQALAFGVTTQLDMWNGGDRLRRIKEMQAADAPELADVRTAGTGATAPGGHPSQMGGPPFPTIAGAGEAQAFVDARLAEGSDYIKIIYDDASTWTWRSTRIPTLDKATLAALVEAAHRRGKLAIVHALSEQQARDAIDAGADGLAHLFSGEAVSSSFGADAARRPVFVVATLAVAYLSCGKPIGPSLLADPRIGPRVDKQWLWSLQGKSEPDKNRFCAATEAALGQLLRAHVPVLAGTDAPLGGPYGAALHGELELLVRNGLTPLQALAAATSAPATAFRLADRGRIRAGLRADLVLVAGDPSRDILATRSIVGVWKRGVRAAA
jgi:imidazolonepropionase-like amidohydrolase